MIEESGKIVAVEDGFAWIENERRTTCGGCAVRKGCGTAAMASLFGQRRTHLRVLNRIDAGIGDTVVIGISESGLVRGSLAVYAAPLFGLFAGALLGNVIGQYVLTVDSDVPAVAGTLVGFVVALIWLKRFSRSIDRDAAYQPVVLRRQSMIACWKLLSFIKCLLPKPEEVINN